MTKHTKITAPGTPMIEYVALDQLVLSDLKPILKNFTKQCWNWHLTIQQQPVLPN